MPSDSSARHESGQLPAGSRRGARQLRAAALLVAPVLAGIGAGLALPTPTPAQAVAPPSVPVPSRRAVPARRLGHLVIEVALTLSALLGLAGLAVTVLVARAEIRPLVVRTGSMAPAVPAGSMVLVQRVAVERLVPGDVVAVDREDGTRVMHRIVAIDRTGPTTHLTLKGDANDEPDPRPVPVVEADRLVWHASGVGRAAAWLATAPGGFALGSLVTGLGALALRGRRLGGKA